MKTQLPRQTPNNIRILPPLENGDRLTRTEFERRYAASPHIKKAELIVRQNWYWTYAQILDVVLKPGATTRDEVANHQCDRLLSKTDLKPRQGKSFSLIYASNLDKIFLLTPKLIKLKIIVPI